ncbi:MAG TPA: LuxR C-terminal-related transcriptional regulator [Gaiellaceae bacterium]|jgi:PAS domain S-box-containing protein
MGLAAALRALDTRLETAIAEVGVPAYLIDRDGTIRWVNHAAEELLGDVVGRKFTRFVAPEDVHSAREIFARKLLGRSSTTDFTLRLLDAEGRRITVEFNSVPVREDGNVVGVFGLGRPLQTIEAPGPSPAPALTPRQHEILRLLGQGLSTSTIASSLGLSEETVRNHIRALLAALDAHSRLEAVAVARRYGLLP